jgi:hypothetical protein
VACFVGAGVWVAVGVALGPGLVMSLKMDPRTLVMGSVAGWRPSGETPDASPGSNDGRLSVAAWACVAGRDRNRQIPPLAIANRAARRMTRRVLGFDIDNSQPPETHPCHPAARPVGY